MVKLFPPDKVIQLLPDLKDAGVVFNPQDIGGGKSHKSPLIELVEWVSNRSNANFTKEELNLATALVIHGTQPDAKDKSGVNALGIAKKELGKSQFGALRKAMLRAKENLCTTTIVDRIKKFFNNKPTSEEISIRNQKQSIGKAIQGGRWS